MGGEGIRADVDIGHCGGRADVGIGHNGEGLFAFALFELSVGETVPVWDHPAGSVNQLLRSKVLPSGVILYVNWSP